MNATKTSFYQQNVVQAKEQFVKYSRKSNGIGLIRLCILLAGGTLLFHVIQTEQVLPTLLVFLFTVFAFLVLIRFHSRISQKKKLAEDAIAMNENELFVAEGTKDSLYDNGSAFEDDGHFYLADLDVFGKKSVFHLLNRCATKMGREHLASWLRSAGSRTQILQRQQVVKELANDYSWWQELQLILFPIRKDTGDVKKMLSYFISQDLRFPKSVFLRVYTRLVPFLSILLLLSGLFYSPVFSFLIGFGILNLLLTMSLSKQVRRQADNLHQGGKLLETYVPAFEKIEQRKWRSEWILGLLSEGNREVETPVSVSIKRLSLLLNRLDARLNMLVGMVLNAFLLWEFRQVYALKEWQKYQSAGILASLEVLGTIEALGSLATLHFNRPDWVFPEIVKEAAAYEARQISHPLLQENRAVPSDYSMENHRIALVTGSNMSGKSTFLRSIGVNAVLAMAGSVVKASFMRISVLQLVTYMRIRDSLNESTSTFKAELNRIQKVLELVKENDHAFFLLDEMLRGTNSMDKYLGSKAIIEKLISLSGRGIVATHDLKLAELSEKYPRIVENFHFDIQVIGEEMQFDYVLKNGPCTTFNASLLLKKIGIEI